MKTKILAIIMLLTLAIGIFALCIHTLPVNAANENVVLSITTTPINKAPADVNSFFDVYVNIAAVTGLFGFDIKVTWTDNTLIQLDKSTSDTNTKALLATNIWPGAEGAKWAWILSEGGGGGGGGGYYRVVALSTSTGFTGSQDLMDLHFQIMRSGNIPLTTTIQVDTFKLSDPNWTPIPATTVPGVFNMAATTPDIELVLIDPTSGKLEYGKTFEVEVYATDVTDMTDFDLTILFNSELLAFVDVDYWGTGWTGSPPILGSGAVQVTGSGAPHTGSSVLLFALTFHIEFDGRIEHIWKTNAAHDLPAQISVENDIGGFSFVEGTVPITGITLPSPMTVTVHLIRGDVATYTADHPDGVVDIWDLRTVAAFYDKSSPVKYDLTMDGTIDIFDLVVIATNMGYGA